MTAPKRRNGIVRRVSLAEFGDGMEEAFAIVTLASFEETGEISARAVDGMTNREAIKVMMEVCKEHFVSGETLLINDDASLQMGPMKVTDISSTWTTEMIQTVYATIVGLTLDPKASPTATEPSPTMPASTEPSSDESNTKTTSPSEAPTSTQ